MKNFGLILSKLRNSKSHLLINLCGLSTAFASSILIMLFVINEFQFDKFNTNKNRIFRVEEGSDIQVPYPISRLSKENFPEIEKSVVIKSINNHWLSYNRNFFEIEEFCFAENSLFEIFTLPFIYGDYHTALESPYTIVLSESVSKKIFGDINPVGKQVNFKNEDYYTVTGVIKDMPDFHLPVKAIASFKSVQDRYGLTDDNWGWALVTYFMLPENNDTKALEKKMNDLFNRNEKWGVEKPDFKLRPLNNIYLATDVQGNDETKHGNLYLLIILIVTGVFILVIASINFINLSISRRARESHEIYIRKILGASTKSIIFKHITDSVFLNLLALLVSFIIVFFLINLYEGLLGRELNLSALINYKFILIAITANLIFGVLGGVLPVLFLLKRGSNQNLGKSLPLHKRMIFNTGLLTFQYAISIILICGTMLTYKQLDFIRNKNLGFNKDQVLSIELTQPLKSNLDNLKKRLLDNPNIMEVSYISDEITQLKEYSTIITIDNEDHLFKFAFIDPDFIQLMGMRLKSGEGFSWDTQTQMNDSYIINEAGWDILKNSTIRENGYIIRNRKLAGVVNNFHFESLHYTVLPMIFFWGKSDQKNIALCKLTNSNTAQTIDYIKETFKDLAPESLCKYTFLDQSIKQLYSSEEMIVKLLGIFSLLALLIASVGIISLSSISAENRTKEIGIRKINGAKVSEVMAMLSLDFLKWVLVAFVIAYPIVWYGMNKWLQNFTYKTNLSMWTIFIAGFLVLVIAFVTVGWKSLHAATKNPVDALRYE